MSHPWPACSTWEEGRESGSWRFLPLPWHSSRSRAPAACTAQGNRQPCPGCGVGKPHPVGQGGLTAAGTRGAAQRGRKALRGPSSREFVWWGWPIRPETRQGRRGVTGRRMRMARRRTEFQDRGTSVAGEGQLGGTGAPPPAPSRLPFLAWGRISRSAWDCLCR